LLGCSKPQLQVLALSDEIAHTCGDLAGRMASVWSASEAARGGPVSFEATESGEMDVHRERCRAAMELLDEINLDRRRLAPDAEAWMTDLVSLDRLLVRSVVHPAMDRTIFAATLEHYQLAHRFIRDRLAVALPLSAAEGEALVNGLVADWQGRVHGSAAY
jgi:hypothetical protein